MDPPQPGTEIHSLRLVKTAEASRVMVILNQPRKATRVGDLYLDFEVRQAPLESEFPAQIEK